MSATMKRVLVVEDDPDARRHIAEAVLCGGHFELADAVPNLTQARRVLSSRPVDVLLTDLQLPDGHGAELIARRARAYLRC